MLVGLKADLKNDDKIKEDLAKRNEVKYNSQWIISFIQEPVTKAAAEEMAKKIGAKGYFETSAKENQGVQELFAEAIKLACGQPDPTEKPTPCCVIA